MKKIYSLFVVLILVLLFTACGSTDADGGEPLEDNDSAQEDSSVGKEGPETAEDLTGAEENSQETAPNNGFDSNAQSQEDMQEKMAELDYTEVELEVEYADGKEYEAEIEKKGNNTVEAEIEDELNNIKKKGTEAFNELFPLIQQLTINDQTTKEDAIKEILDVFDLPTDYEKFDLEIRFKDGVQVEYEDRK